MTFFIFKDVGERSLTGFVMRQLNRLQTMLRVKLQSDSPSLLRVKLQSDSPSQSKCHSLRKGNFKGRVCGLLLGLTFGGFIHKKIWTTENSMASLGRERVSERVRERERERERETFCFVLWIVFSLQAHKTRWYET